MIITREQLDKLKAGEELEVTDGKISLETDCLNKQLVSIYCMDKEVLTNYVHKLHEKYKCSTLIYPHSYGLYFIQCFVPVTKMPEIIKQCLMCINIYMIYNLVDRLAPNSLYLIKF